MSLRPRLSALRKNKQPKKNGSLLEQNLNSSSARLL
jgi:hypothetical protein